MSPLPPPHGREGRLADIRREVERRKADWAKLPLGFKPHPDDSTMVAYVEWLLELVG